MTPRSPTSPATLPIDAAADLLRRGDKVAARQTLRRWLKDHPDDEAAWRLLTEAAETPTQVAYCLDQVLRLDPGDLDSVLARETALRAARGATAPANRAMTAASSTPRAMLSREKEEVVLTARISPVLFAGPGLVLGLGLLLGVVGLLNQDWVWLAVIGGAVGLMGVMAFLQVAMVYFFDALTLTTRRLIIKRGVLRRATFEVLLPKVEGIGVDQPLVGRLLGYGTLEVTGTGGARQAFPGLARPLAFQEAVQAQVEAVGRSG